jgi:hypothetical protein
MSQPIAIEANVPSSSAHQPGLASCTSCGKPIDAMDAFQGADGLLCPSCHCDAELSDAPDLMVGPQEAPPAWLALSWFLDLGLFFVLLFALDAPFALAFILSAAVGWAVRTAGKSLAARPADGAALE